MKASFIFITISSALLLGSCRAQHAESAQDRVERLNAQDKALEATLAKLPYYVPVKGKPPLIIKAPAESGYGAKEIPLTQLKPEDYGKVFCPKGTRSVVIPEGVVRIPKLMCAQDLPSQLPDSYVYIEKVSLPSTLKSIGGFAFIRNKIKELSLPEGLKRIGFGAFEDNKLEHVALPQSLQVIGKEAFHWNKLISITLPRRHELIIGDFAFAGNKLSSLTLPRRHELFIDRGAFEGNKLRSLVLPKNAELVGVGNFNYNELTQLTIEEGVTSIPPYAFSGNKFKGVTLPSTITGLGVGAFDGDGLRDITILASRAPKVIYLKKGYGESFIGRHPRYLIDGSGIKIHVPRDAKGYRGRWVWWGFSTGVFTVKHDATG